jgi:hypothetical protein
MKPGRNPFGVLRERHVTDENFDHCLNLLGICAAWCEGIKEGQKLDFNDRNMVQIPVEIALAFVRERATEDSDLGRACLASLKQFARLRDLFASDEPAISKAEKT